MGNYHAPGTVAEALDLLARYGDACRIIAGGTDLILELERGVRAQRILIDISRIPDLDIVTLRDNTLQLGARATHSQVIASPEAVTRRVPAGACVLAGGRAADPKSRHGCGQPRHRQPSQRHHHAAVGHGCNCHTGQPGYGRTNAQL